MNPDFISGGAFAPDSDNDGPNLDLLADMMEAAGDALWNED